jgi:hypothetical protein
LAIREQYPAIAAAGSRAGLVYKERLGKGEACRYRDRRTHVGGGATTSIG